MDEDEYYYHIDLQTPDGNPLGKPLVIPKLDCEPVREWARFQSFLQRGDEVPDPVEVTPRWDDEKGEPFVSGLQVRCESEHYRIPRQFFEPLAKQHSKQLLEQSLLKKGDLYRYEVTAIRPETQGVPDPPGAMVISEEEMPWRFEAASPLERVAEPILEVGEEHGREGDLPVYLPHQVLEEAAEETRRLPSVETGGVLIGYLCRDPESGQAGLVVSAQIAATDTEAGATHLTFTPRTWAAVNDAIALRRDGSMIVGWWHSHPANEWCNPNCSEEARAQCPLKKSFFSEMDVSVHRTVFCQAYSTALVLTNTDEEIKYALYGWRRGMVERRGFHLTGSTAAAAALAKACAAEGEQKPETTEALSE